MGEKSQSCGLGLRSIRAKKHGDQAHPHAMFCNAIPGILLTVSPADDAVALHLGPCEKRLCCEKLATSSSETKNPHTISCIGGQYSIIRFVSYCCSSIFAPLFLCVEGWDEDNLSAGIWTVSVCAGAPHDSLRSSRRRGSLLRPLITGATGSGASVCVCAPRARGRTRSSGGCRTRRR